RASPWMEIEEDRTPAQRGKCQFGARVRLQCEVRRLVALVDHARDLLAEWLEARCETSSLYRPRTRPAPGVLARHLRQLLRELRSRLKDLVAPAALDDEVGGATNDVHPVRVRGLRLTLPNDGGEIGIVEFGDEIF